MSRYLSMMAPAQSIELNKSNVSIKTIKGLRAWESGSSLIGLCVRIWWFNYAIGVLILSCLCSNLRLEAHINFGT